MGCRAWPRSRCSRPRLHGTALVQLPTFVVVLCLFLLWGLDWWMGRQGERERDRWEGWLFISLLVRLSRLSAESGQDPSVLDCSSLFLLSWGVGSTGLCNPWQASQSAMMAWILSGLFGTTAGLVAFCFFWGTGSASSAALLSPPSGDCISSPRPPPHPSLADNCLSPWLPVLDPQAVYFSKSSN